MEKRKPHCELSIVKMLIAIGRVRLTAAAFRGGSRMGFDRNGIVDVVGAPKPSDFYKSMTTFENHRVWQDVYRPMTSAGKMYLKLTVIEDVLVVSFKEL